MSLTTIRGDALCDNGRTCPHVSATGRGSLVVQGYLVSDAEVATKLGLAAEEIAIEVPLTLLPELAAAPGPLCITDRGTVLMHGAAASHPDDLAELTIPSGEAAIEIPAATLPFLEVAGLA